MEYHKYLYPQYFIPELNIVDIPEECSAEVVKRMREAFKLFFASQNAALNALRSALEYVLDDLGIPRLNGSGKRMNLHQRIESVDPAMHGFRTEWLLALKIMGNSGTHGEEVDMHQLLDGCEVMEAVLAKVYQKQQLKRIDEIAEATIKRKNSV